MPTRPYVPRKLYQTNKSGHVGIYWRADINAYCVQRLVNGKRKTIGYRSSIEAAIALYNEPIQQQDSPGHHLYNGHTARLHCRFPSNSRMAARERQA